MKLALKIDVDTYRGTLIGVPRLIQILRRHQAQATFLFSLGPDYTGRAIKRVFRPGFLSKVSRTSVLSHYGLKTLLYGTLLPGPDIGLRCASILRGVKNAGYEVGIHTWDHIKWQDNVVQANQNWTECELLKASKRFQQLFGMPAHVHGAAGWQMNAHAVRLMQRLGFAYSSDCRGDYPFMPVYRGEVVFCPQLPTTLPTLDELIGCEGITTDNVHAHLLALTADRSKDHVFTLHAELEGMKLAPVFERLLTGWRSQGYELSNLKGIADQLDVDSLPRCEWGYGEVPGRSGKLMVQGAVLSGA